MKRRKRKNPDSFLDNLSIKARDIYKNLGYTDNFGRFTEISVEFDDLFSDAEIWLEKARRKWDLYQKNRYKHNLEKYKEYIKKANRSLEEIYDRLKEKHKMRYSSRRTTTRKRNPGETLVVASKVKDYIKSKGMRASADIVDALSEKIRYKIDKAVVRAKANKRQTLRAEDI